MKKKRNIKIQIPVTNIEKLKWDIFSDEILRYLKKKYPESEHSDFEKLFKEILEEWNKMKNRTPIRLIK